MKTKFYKMLLPIIGFIIILVAIFVNYNNLDFVKAEGNTESLSGYAWSDNIGWISFATSTSNPNGVQITDPLSGILDGYAWSDNIGWIKFGSSLYEADPNGGDGSSYVDPDTNVLYGWARACAGTYDGVCGGTTHTYTPYESQSCYKAGYNWDKQNSLGEQYFKSISSSQDGNKIITGQGYYGGGELSMSNDGGNTWTRSTSPGGSTKGVVGDVESSADGTKLILSEGFGYYSYVSIYTSGNSGNSWTKRLSVSANPLNCILAGWSALDSSSDGTIIFATYSSFKNGSCCSYLSCPETWERGGIYRSTDSGVNWTKVNSSMTLSYQSVQVSSDGSKVVATSNTTTGLGGSSIAISSNGGSTWSYQRPWPNSGYEYPGDLAMSSDGNTIFITTGSNIWKSVNAGSTWQTVPKPDQFVRWFNIISSDDGSKVVAIGTDGLSNNNVMWISNDGGNTWTYDSCGPYSDLYKADLEGSSDLSKVFWAGEKYTGPGNFYKASYDGIFGTSTSLIPLTPITTDSRSDGWDGWIALSDPAGLGSYGVTLDSSTPSFAWGSDVLGWIDFSGVTTKNELPIIDGVCSYTPNSYADSIGQALCSSGIPTPITITEIIPADLNGAKYSQAWRCDGEGVGSSGQDCVLRTKYASVFSAEPTLLNARLTPNIVNMGEICSVSILDPNLSTIMASSTCAIYLDSNPPTSYSAGGNFADQTNLPEVDPGKDYKILCKDKIVPTKITHTSKTLKCVLNPIVKEI